MPPTMPPAAVPPGAPARPPTPASPFATPGVYPPLPGASANPYTTAPSAVPPSEYGPIRDIYDPNFAAAYYGGAMPQDAPAPDVPAGRLTGLEPRSSRRRRTIFSGAATALAVVLVVGLIAFAVWQTQQGDDGRESARNAGGTPPAAPAADQPAAAEDAAAGETAGDVTAGAPGTGNEPTAVPTAVPEGGQADETAPDDDPEDSAAAEDPAGDQEPAADEAEDGAGDAAGADDATDGEDAGAEPTANPGGRSLANLVPAEDEIPDGFIQTNEVSLEQDEVAALLGDPEAASAQLDAWGWRGHLQREFARSPDAPVEAGEPSYFVVSVHRFDSPETTDEALTFFTDLVIGGGAAVTEAEPQGDESILLVGTADEVTTVNLYIRTGPYLVRVVGGSPDGDPTADVVALAGVILVNEPDAA